MSGARSIVILTGDGPEHRYVANRLCLALPISGVVVDVSVRRASARRAFRDGLRSGVSRIALHLFRKATKDGAARRTALETVLGSEVTSRFVAEDKVVRVDGVNSREAVEALERLHPDAIAVYGTTIVRDPVLSQANDIAFNMHTGISPHYRGTDCSFWPIVNGEPDRIGATVHECTAEVDGGQIFAAARASWAPDDGLHHLFARAVAKGADLYVEALQRYLAGILEGERQDPTEGREYRGSMRTLGAELRARWALSRGLLRRADVPG